MLVLVAGATGNLGQKLIDSLYSRGHQYPLTLIAKTYGQVRNCHVDIRKTGDEEELRKIALEARRQGTRRFFWPYIGWFYQLFTTDRLWVLEELDNDKLYVKTSSLEEFLRQYPQL
ncbi:hypothetical protein FOC1_g10003740 [Fusarium oxysporum f. sp. cubense race 1]|uniref:NmrA-like domain-containing protein n=1 Tax=Fusarium oxysporum f. sp. cubense (strain race 1) TaxID=1229664 RepID=N4U9P1_FUSC1|nr:hypothetical protein FOC1_g10003740 [Fusarium oxysporum f. sp. cubense race 1]